MSTKKSAEALNATAIISNIILERNLIHKLPYNKQISFTKMSKQIRYNLPRLRNYIYSEIFTLSNSNIKITDDNELLINKSKDYCMRLIKKYIYPSQFEKDEYVFNVGKLFDNSYYTNEELNFINLIYNSFTQILNIELNSNITNIQNLIEFNSINDNEFYSLFKQIYNEILKDKIHYGDNIYQYFKEFGENEEMQNVISKKLKSSTKYDYIFDNNYILKCDMKTNFDILIKNIINSTIYEFNDYFTKIILLIKLQTKYPLLIEDKIFYCID